MYVRKAKAWWKRHGTAPGPPYAPHDEDEGCTSGTIKLHTPRRDGHAQSIVVSHDITWHDSTDDVEVAESSDTGDERCLMRSRGAWIHFAVAVTSDESDMARVLARYRDSFVKVALTPGCSGERWIVYTGIR